MLVSLAAMALKLGQRLFYMRHAAAVTCSCSTYAACLCMGRCDARVWSSQCHVNANHLNSNRTPDKRVCKRV